MKTKYYIGYTSLLLAVIFIISLYIVLVFPDTVPYKLQIYNSKRDILNSKVAMFTKSRNKTEITMLGKSITEMDHAKTTLSVRELDLYYKTMNKEHKQYNEQVLRSFDTVCSNECVCSRAGFHTYGKYCGWGYTGCSGHGCNYLDDCCRIHDKCVGNHGLLDCDCNHALAECAHCAYWIMENNDEIVDEWTCDNSLEAAIVILSDISYVPPCFPDDNEFFF